MKLSDDASGCGGVKVGEEDESATTLFFMDNEKTNSYDRYYVDLASVLMQVFFDNFFFQFRATNSEPFDTTFSDTNTILILS